MPKNLQTENDNTKKLKIKRIVFFAALILFIISIIFVAFLKRKEETSLKEELIIRNQTFNIKIADTESERRQGLMNVESMPTNEGMLFVYEEEGYRTFWMKNTLIPLDMIFIDDAEKIVEIFNNVPPCTEELCQYYRCEKGAKYVLEINGGLSEEYGFKMGDKVEITSTREK